MKLDSLNVIEKLQQIDKHITYLLGDHTLTVIFFLLSSVFAYFLYRRSKPTRELVFFLGVNTIYESTKSDKILVSVTFNGQPVNWICQSVLGIINTGRSTIRKEDIAMKDPLRFNITDNYKIYSAEILSQNRQAFQFDVPKTDEKFLEVNFDFLEPNDIVLIKLIHNCNLEPWNYIDKFYPSGSVIGIPKINYYGDNPAHDPTSGVLPISMTGALIFGTFISYLLFKLSQNIPNIVYIAIYSIIFLILIYLLLRPPFVDRLFHKTVKKTQEKTED